MTYIVSWSGGKDSCFACYQAILSGYAISYLVNFISKEYKRVSFHGTEAKLIQLQSEAIRIPLLQKETTWDGYENEFKDAVKSLIPNGVKGMVFGDIYLQEHRDWVERVCGELGIEAIEPLWRKEPEKILFDFIDVGFEAIIVSAKSDLIEEKWIGRRVDREFLRYLKNNNIDLCGENGEYHTFVTNGPLFKKKIEITKSKTITRNGYWFLDTIEYSLHDLVEPATHRRLRLLGLTSFDSYNKRVSGFGNRLRPNPSLSLRTSDTRQKLYSICPLAKIFGSARLFISTKLYFPSLSFFSQPSLYFPINPKLC